MKDLEIKKIIRILRKYKRHSAGAAFVVLNKRNFSYSEEKRCYVFETPYINELPRMADQEVLFDQKVNSTATVKLTYEDGKLYVSLEE